MSLRPPIDRVSAGLFEFEKVSTERIETRAAAVFPPGGYSKRGKSEERWRASIAGRAVLADLFKAIGFEGYVRPIQPFGYLGVFDKNGKPVPLQANLSHTDNVAVAAISPSPVGIDVERLDRSAERVLRRVSTDAELAYVDGKQVGDLPLPIALWSAKEAVSKAVGLGIKFGMKVFEIDFSSKSPHGVVLRERGPLTLSSPAVVCRLEKPWVVSLATERAVLERGIDWQTRG